MQTLAEIHQLYLMPQAFANIRNAAMTAIITVNVRAKVVSVITVGRALLAKSSLALGIAGRMESVKTAFALVVLDLQETVASGPISVRKLSPHRVLRASHFIAAMALVPSLTGSAQCGLEKRSRWLMHLYLHGRLGGLLITLIRKPFLLLEP